MKCLRCDNEALPAKALCEQCLTKGRSGVSSPSSTDAAKNIPEQQERSELDDSASIPVPPRPQSITSQERVDMSKMPVEPAGFWLRVFAYGLDSALLSIPLTLAQITSDFAGNALSDAISRSVQTSATGLSGFAMMTLFGFSGFLGLISLFLLASGTLYMTFFEASSLQATPGKLFFKIIVTDSQGLRLTLGRAFLRNIGRFAFMAPIFLLIIPGGILLAFKMKQLGTSAVTLGLIASGAIMFCHYLMAAFTYEKRALHDFIAGTYVIRREELGFPMAAFRALISVLFGILLSIALFHFQGAKNTSPGYRFIYRDSPSGEAL